jgi:hypothetical protein
MITVNTAVLGPFLGCLKPRRSLVKVTHPVSLSVHTHEEATEWINRLWRNLILENRKNCETVLISSRSFNSKFTKKHRWIVELNSYLSVNAQYIWLCYHGHLSRNNPPWEQPPARHPTYARVIEPTWLWRHSYYCQESNYGKLFVYA